MHRFSLTCILLSFLLLLPSFTGCGEIELPIKKVENPQETQPENKEPESSDPEEGEGSDDTAPSAPDDTSAPDDSSASDDPSASDDTGSTEESGENADDGKEKEQRIGYACFTADGHVLIADSLYLSVYHVRSVASAFNANNPKAAILAAEAYEEGNLTKGWRVPTEDEARFLLGMYASTAFYYGSEPLPVLNRELESRLYDMISLDDRYLCADGAKTFCFELGKKITKAGAVTTYRLRLVHDK